MESPAANYRPEIPGRDHGKTLFHWEEVKAELPLLLCLRLTFHGVEDFLQKQRSSGE